MLRLLSVAVFALALAAGHESYAQALNAQMKAAESGDSGAEFGLAERYETGDGVEKNLTKGFCWMHRAAEHGNPYAWLSIGISYGMGAGVAKDNVESYKWFYLVNLLAEPNWNSEVRQWASEDVDRIARQMTPAQIAEAKRRAHAWWDAVKARGRPAANQQFVRFPGDKPKC